MQILCISYESLIMRLNEQNNTSVRMYSGTNTKIEINYFQWICSYTDKLEEKHTNRREKIEKVKHKIRNYKNSTF